MCRKMSTFLLTIVIVCTVLGFAHAEQPENPPIFNEKVMYKLLSYGYEWNDLVQASILTHNYQIPLETILRVKQSSQDWKATEKGLTAWNEARKMFQRQIPLSAEVQSLVDAGFTEKEIAYIAYLSVMQKEPLSSSKDKFIKEKHEEKTKKVLDFANTLELVVSPDYTLNGTTTPTYVDPGLGYDVAKCTPFQVVLANSNETISPATGYLSIVETDVSLPGRNGLDFNLTRIYQSEKAELQKPGYQVKPVYDEILEFNITTGYNTMDQFYHIGVGWSFDIPMIEMVYGSPQYVHVGQGSTYKVNFNSETGLQTSVKGYIFVQSNFSEYPDPTEVVYYLKHISGVVHYFNSQGQLLWTLNKYGNRISYEWDSNGYLKKVTDTVNRVITFTYTSDLVTVTIPASPTPYQIKYYKRPRTGEFAKGQCELSRVELPEQIVTSYEYGFQSAQFDLVWSDPGTNYYLNLTARTNPYGGKSIYTYSNNYSRKEGNYQKYFKVTSRYDIKNSYVSNCSRFTYQGHDIEDQNYTTTIEYAGNLTFSPVSKKDVLTFDTYHNNVRTDTTITDRPEYQETKKVAYYRGLPERTEIIKSNVTTGVSKTTSKVDTDFDEYGNLLSSKDSDGRFSQSRYEYKTYTGTASNYHLTESSIQRVNTTDKEDYVQESNLHDSYGNITETTLQEYTATYQTTTENILSSPGKATQFYPWFIQLPDGATKVVLSISSNAYEVQIRIWEEGQARPKDTEIKYYSSSFSWSKTLSPLKDYVIEVSAFAEGYSPTVTINSATVTYNKRILAPGAVESKTYNHYAAPAAFGMPDQIHQEYGSGGATHSSSFAADNCIVTCVEYLATVDNPATGENYINMFPSRITQDVRNADLQNEQQVTDLRYNKFGKVTQIKKGILTNTYVYDGINRLKSEKYQSTSEPGSIVQKDYFYSSTLDARGYFYTEISHHDGMGTGSSDNLTRFYYDEFGRHVETQTGPLNSAIITEKVSYDAYCETAN